MRYIIITVDDAKTIAVAMIGADGADAARIAARLAADTGGDIDEIVSVLKGLDICAACSIEGQSGDCYSLDARKQGRRLGRLLERARGERVPGPVDWAAVELAAKEAQLRDAGWLPADPSQEAYQEGDWTPPEDRSNVWDFERALREMRRRARRAPGQDAQ